MCVYADILEIATKKITFLSCRRNEKTVVF